MIVTPPRGAVRGDEVAEEEVVSGEEALAALFACFLLRLAWGENMREDE